MSAEGRWKVLIADDHPVVRQGIRAALSRASDLEVLAEVGDGLEACRVIRKLRPDLAILDYRMPGLNGLEVVRQMNAQGVSCDFIILTMHKEEGLFNAIMDEGVLGFVLKDNAIEDLLSCIQAVRLRQYYISPEISDLLLRRHDRARELERNIPALGKLSPGERQILKLIGEGRTSKEIAEMLFLSAHTVDNYRARIADKLQIQGTHSLLKFAFEHRSSL